VIGMQERMACVRVRVCVCAWRDLSVHATLGLEAAGRDIGQLERQQGKAMK
jgi:hypothetical protein